MTSTGWRPLPLILGCFGCLFSALLNIWRWILRQKCCQNNNYCCCCYCHNSRNTRGKKSLIKIEEGTTINEEQQQSISVDQPLLLLCSPLPLIEGVEKGGSVGDWEIGAFDVFINFGMKCL